MTELSHQDIKNAIMGASAAHNTDTTQNSGQDQDQPALPGIERLVPDTPYEGFVGSEPTEEERALWQPAKEKVAQRHQARESETTTDQQPRGQETSRSFPNWVKYGIGGLVASIVFAGGAVAYQLKRGNDIVEELTKPSKTIETAAPAIPGDKTATNTKTYEPLIDQASCEANPSDFQPSVVECNAFGDLSPEDQQIILRAEQATPAEFERLPKSIQEKFQNFVIANNAPHAIFVENQILANGNLTDYSLQDYDPSFSMKNDDGVKSANQLSVALAVYDDLKTSDGHYDKTTAYKLLSAIAVQGSPAYNRLKKGIDTADISPFDGAGINTNFPLNLTGFIDATDTKDVTVDNKKYHEQTSTTILPYEPIGTSPKGVGLNIKPGNPVVRIATTDTKTLDGNTTNILLVDANPQS